MRLNRLSFLKAVLLTPFVRLRGRKQAEPVTPLGVDYPDIVRNGKWVYMYSLNSVMRCPIEHYPRGPWEDVRKTL